jgi:hypothetical protein
MVYQDIIVISNDIRAILDTSRQARLAAVNAALVARRAGHVKGFEAVAGELKNFSQCLTAAMHEMAEHILGVSQVVSSLYRQRHSLRLHEGASALSGAAGHGAVLARAASHQHAFGVQLAQRVWWLAQYVIRALRLCLTGRNLARAAMVEAAYGGAATPMLKNVAVDIETAIDTIHGRLKTIHNRIRSA